MFVPNPSFVRLATLCKCVVYQDTFHCKLGQWIFEAMKIWDGANVVFAYKVKLLFCLFVEKIKALVVWVFQYFS